MGKDYNLRKDAAGRAICGISSGGICAFTAAWERPDLFSKVLVHVGSFTNIRGGDVYPGLIRKTEQKPIRVFLQDGSGDLDNLHGNWPLANQQMASALHSRSTTTSSSSATAATTASTAARSCPTRCGAGYGAIIQAW